MAATEAMQRLSAALLMKTTLLCEGVRIEPRVTDLAPFKARLEHLYRHDRGAPIPFGYPQELVLVSGSATTGGDPMVVNVRSNPLSRWRLTCAQEAPVVLGPDDEPWEVALTRVPPYYSTTLSDGQPTSRVAQMMGVDLVGAVPNNHCFYFTDGSECVFCEILSNYRHSKTFPRIRKPTPLLIEALHRALEPGNGVRHVVLTSGNHRTLDETAKVNQDVLRGLGASPHRGGVFVFASQMAPETFAAINELASAGLDAVAFNMEAWEPAAFARLAPGKAAYGRSRMLAALDHAVEVFGAGRVYSNLVYGIQSLSDELDPTSIDPVAEHDLGLAAAQGLLARGVLPLFTIYHSTGVNRIGQVHLNPAVVLAFHLAYAELVHDSGLVPPQHTGVLFSLGSITNHLYNDALVTVRAKAAASGVTR